MRDDCGCSGGCGRGIDRRTLIKGLAAGAATWTLADGSFPSRCEAAVNSAPDHFIPIEKKLNPQWLRSLVDRGERTFYHGEELDTIGMPVGGIGCGQLYLAGDGRLVHWDIFNRIVNSGFGATNYREGRKPAAPVAQGFAVHVAGGGKTAARPLDREGFPGVRFCGEYPIGTVEYRDPGMPVAVTLEAFSPFIPLCADDSGLPATVMHFTVRNVSSAPVDVTLAGWLENAACIHSGGAFALTRRNRIVREKGLAMVLGAAEGAKPGAAAERPPIVLADFEGADYGAWTVEGQALGRGPARGTLPGQQPVGGFEGRGLVNSFNGGDAPQGKLRSPAFKIERRFISFLIGGGNNPGATCMNLLVDGKVARKATGKNQEQLQWENWNVQDLAGQEARIEIVDAASGPWGHVNVDQIELRDSPRAGTGGKLEEQADFGTLGLAVLGEGVEIVGTASLPASAKTGAEWCEALFGAGGLSQAAGEAERPAGAVLCGAIGKNLSLVAGGEASITFMVTWCFPNLKEGNNLSRGNSRRRGNQYGVRFEDAGAVARYVAGNFGRLDQQTRLWRRTWYDSTLPHWLLDRLFSTTSILATSTCQRWADGRFWAWEGVGCCAGTCGHVWNYAHAMARLFPELERSVRERQDYNPEAGFDPATGAIRFRGEDNTLWAGDSQPGYVLKVYREHQVSVNGAFLKRLWPNVRKSLEFLIREDGNADGLIEGQQHNTYDINFFGANTMTGSLYLGALRAGEEMAREMGDGEFAATCRKVFESGRKLSVDRLFNGEYFIQQVDLAQHPKHQYAEGCLADQMFGQGWARQVGLGELYPKENVVSALQSIWKYNWAPDVAVQNKAHPPQRWFAMPGEGGLFTCTWPRSRHLGKDSVLYRDEIWTGIEYQVAGHMIWEGMLTEALVICRTVHDRYQPAKRNPWNEVECGDHYARAMASYGVFLALCGFEYHGPKGHMAFAPRLTPENFRAPFTTAEGWGTFAQERKAGGQVDRIELRWGRLRVRQLQFQLPENAQADKAAVSVGGKAAAFQMTQEKRTVTLRFEQEILVESPAGIEVSLQVT